MVKSNQYWRNKCWTSDQFYYTWWIVLKISHHHHHPHRKQLQNMGKCGNLTHILVYSETQCNMICSETEEPLLQSIFSWIAVPFHMWKKITSDTFRITLLSQICYALWGFKNQLKRIQFFIQFVSESLKHNWGHKMEITKYSFLPKKTSVPDITIYF